MSSLRSVFDASSDRTVCIVAEAGVNHDGEVDEAHALIDVAADAGADVVKFQTFEPDSLVSATARTAPYQAAASVTTQLELLGRYVLPRSAWAELQDHARQRGLGFMSTAFDHDSVDLICDLGVEALKLGSGELTNRSLLEDVASRGLPVICSTGMASADEVADAVEWLAAAPDLALMHCVSSYPAPADQANLLAIPAMAEEFGVPVGWSDHTVGHLTATVAVALGARLLEKHVTRDVTRAGPDHAASADPSAFRSYVELARLASDALGDGEKRAAPAERENVQVVRRSWHAARDLVAGHRMQEGDAVLLRPATGLAPAIDLHGRRLVRDVAGGAPLTGEDIADA